MRILLFVILLIALMDVAGCRFASHAPNPEWLADFQKADAILIRNNDQELTVSDAETIDRLQSIYTNAKWTPYWHTLPGHLDERTITLLDGESKMRGFSYPGSLWETHSYSENRTGELSEADHQWLESLFALVSDEETTVENAK